MSETVTADRVWNALLSNSDFTEEVPEGQMRNLFRDWVNEAFPIVSPRLDDKVDLKTFVQVKAAIAKKAIEFEFVKKMMMVVPEEMLQGQDRAEAAEKTHEHQVLRLSMYETAVAEVTNPPEDGKTRALPLVSRSFGLLDGPARDELNAGTLTVGRLLLLQPMPLLAHL